MDPRRIVVGLDFSPASFAAARWAARHLAPPVAHGAAQAAAQGAAHDTELVLAHVIAIPEPPPLVQGRYPRRELLVETVREGADRRLRELGQALAPVRTWLEVREGEVTPTLAAVARDFGAELLVVGAHGERPGLAGALGGTAAHLVRDAAVPVLLVAGAADAASDASGDAAGDAWRADPPNGPRGAAAAPILVPVDRSPTAATALRWAATLRARLAPANGAVTVLHVVPPGVVSRTLTAVAVASGTIVPDPVDHRREPMGTEEWDALAAAAGLAPGEATSTVVVGEPAAEIVAAARRLGAGLVVMGRRGGGAVGDTLRRAVLGSVVEAVLRDAPCPVLVVPDEAVR